MVLFVSHEKAYVFPRVIFISAYRDKVRMELEREMLLGNLLLLLSFMFVLLL